MKVRWNYGAVWRLACRWGVQIPLEEIKKKLQRDPDLFLQEIDNEIVGTIIGGYDGRRGMIYHLAVKIKFAKTWDRNHAPRGS